MPATERDQSVVHTGVLADLPVTREATTSRVLVNNPLLRVVDFAFDEGQLLTEHTSPRAVTVTLLELPQRRLRGTHGTSWGFVLHQQA